MSTRDTHTTENVIATFASDVFNAHAMRRYLSPGVADAIGDTVTTCRPHWPRCAAPCVTAAH